VAATHWPPAATRRRLGLTYLSIGIVVSYIEHRARLRSRSFDIHKMSPLVDLQEVLDSEIKYVLGVSQLATAQPLFPSAGSGISVYTVMSTLDAVDVSFVTDIYFHQKNEREHQAALELRDAVLRLRRGGAFVAVPLWRVNLEPIGPHPVGESWISFPHAASG
jgi:Dopa 4,5-dioxygenase family